MIAPDVNKTTSPTESMDSELLQFKYIIKSRKYYVNESSLIRYRHHTQLSHAPLAEEQAAREGGTQSRIAIFL